MQAHILALHTTTNTGVGSNVISIHFLKVVMLHIKVMVTMQAHILSLHTPDPCFFFFFFFLGGGGGSKGHCSESSHVAYQIKGNGT